jgi:hypothetical protein
MTRNVFDSLLEAAERLLEKPEPPAPEPTPEPPPAAEPPPTPEPPGLDRLPAPAREAVRPFLERFEVRRVTLLPPDVPEPEPPYGRGKQGHRAWLLRNLEAQAAEHRRAGESDKPTEPSQPRRRAAAATPAGRVEIRRDGASRWLLFVGEPLARVPEFATPWFDHARREAEARFGRPKGGWRFD